MTGLKSKTARMNYANSRGTVPRDCIADGEKIPHRIAENEKRRAGHRHTFYWSVLGNVQTPKPSSYALKARSGGGAESFEVPSKPQAGSARLGCRAREDVLTRCLVAGRYSAARLVVDCSPL